MQVPTVEFFAPLPETVTLSSPGIGKPSSRRLLNIMTPIVPVPHVEQFLLNWILMLRYGPLPAALRAVLYCPSRRPYFVALLISTSSRVDPSSALLFRMPVVASP